jgi:PAS domain S-box-containing protein
MRLLAQSGRRESALQQYELCASLLKRELRLDPDAETLKLRDEIVNGYPPKWMRAPAGVERAVSAGVARESESPPADDPTRAGRAADDERGALPSASDDLGAVTPELCRRIAEFNQASAKMQAAVDDLEPAVAVVDGDFRVLAWNRKGEELWGVSADAARGRALAELRIGLPVAALRDPLSAALGDAGARSLSVEAVDRRGRSTVCRVTVIPLDGSSGMRGALIAMKAVS